jgi:hypothetical protein
MKTSNFRSVAANAASVAGLWLAFVLASPLSASAANETEKAPAKPAEAQAPKASEPVAGTVWTNLFDGKTLAGWKPSDFAGAGAVKVDNGQIVIDMGNNMSGITWTNPVMRMDYEIQMDAMRVEGSDFFCGLTFPVGKEPCTLILGGWGGGLVGLSSIDGSDASQNQTTTFMQVESGRWYHVRLRVTQGRIQAWVDDERKVDFKIEERTLSIRIEVEASKPLGVATYATKAALKNIQWRHIAEPEPDAAKKRRQSQ